MIDFNYTPTTIRPPRTLQYDQPQQEQQPSMMSGLAGLLGQADETGLIDGIGNFFTGGGGGIEALSDVGGPEGAAAGGMGPVASLAAAEAGNKDIWSNLVSILMGALK